MTRANISVDKAVYDEFASQAMLRGKTLYALTNEWLDAAAKISAEGGSAADVTEVWRSTSVLKQLDTIILPSDFVDEMIVSLYAKDKAQVLRSFYDLGAELAGILKIVADSLQRLSELVRDFTLFTPIRRFEVRQLNDGTSEIDVVGAGKKAESTECCYEFLKAVLNGYGYDVQSHQLYVGTIRLTAIKRRSS